MNEGSVIERWRHRARQLKVETYALYLAYRDPRAPWVAKLVAAGVVSYAFSPIDLIPDFIPVLGYLDDLVIVPLDVALALGMIPGPVLDECRARARETLSQDQPTNWVAAGVIAGGRDPAVHGAHWLHRRLGPRRGALAHRPGLTTSDPRPAFAGPHHL